MALTKADINKISDMIKLTVMAVVSEAIKTVIQDNSINLKQKPINYREKTIKKLEAYSHIVAADVTGGNNITDKQGGTQHGCI